MHVAIAQPLPQLNIDPLNQEEMVKQMMNFNMPEDMDSSIIKVIGVGGGGSNAVNHMFRRGIRGVDFVVCNTDKQALDMSPVPTKIALGQSLTEGRGAGAQAAVGRNAALENLEDIKAFLSDNTKMVFITAGMGGGTGTGAAPVIAQVAKEMGILTVAIVTVPFNFEGKRRRVQADSGLEELRNNVDTMLVICNDKLREVYGNLKLSEAFGQADDILTTAASRSRQDSWASSAKKIRPLEKKLGRKPATPQIIRKSAVKNFCYKFLGQFLPIIVKIRPQLGNLELGRFLGR